VPTRISPLRLRSSQFLILLAVISSITCFTLSPTKRAQALPTLDSEEQTFLKLINEYRAQNGLGPLQASVALTNASKWMSNDMAQNNYFSHTDSLGHDPFQRMSAFLYGYSTWRGENIAAGYPGAADMFVLWKNSPPHNQNMLNPNYKVIGIGRAYGANSIYKWYWTTDFGGYVDQTITAAAPTPPPTPIPTPTPTQVPTPTPTPTPQPALINLAFGKPAFASSTHNWWGDMSAGAAVDGDETTMWHSETNLSQLEYLQIDLGQPAALNRVEVVFRQDQDQPNTRQNFAVLASNDPSFRSGVVALGAQESAPAPFQQPWSKDLSLAQRFRYVRFTKTSIDVDYAGQAYWNLNEVRVFGPPPSN